MSCSNESCYTNVICDMSRSNEPCRTNMSHVAYEWVTPHREKSIVPHTATHFNTLQHTATRCNTLQHAATTLCVYSRYLSKFSMVGKLIAQHTATHCNTLQHTATHCNTLQHTATHCNTLQQHCVYIVDTWAKSAWSGNWLLKLVINLRSQLWSLQCVAVCCSVLQCVAVRCSVLQCVAVCCSVWQCVASLFVKQTFSEVSCEVCSVLQCVAVRCSVLQCVAVCCSVLRCVAVRCSVWHPSSSNKHSEKSTLLSLRFQISTLPALCSKVRTFVTIFHHYTLEYFRMFSNHWEYVCIHTSYLYT